MHEKLKATRVGLLLDRTRMFRWHQWMRDALISQGCEVFVLYSPESYPLPRSFHFLFAIERAIYRLKGESAIDPTWLIESTAKPEQFDVVLDLSGTMPATLPSANRYICPLFNGVAGEFGAIAEVVNDRPFALSLIDSGRPEPWTARPASRDRSLFVKSLDGILSVTVDLIIKALCEPASETFHIGLGVTIRNATGTVLYAHALRSLTHKVSEGIARLIHGREKWAVGYRYTVNGGILDQRQASYSVLADGGERFFADPFPYRANGAGDFIFVEQFRYDTGRGNIAVLKLNDDRRVSEPVTIIDEPFHMSYPFIFEHGGEMWMIPETGEAKGVFLYRATKFPYEWTKEGRLLDIEGYDATLIEHGNRLWMFVTEGWGRDSSGWDELSLFSADGLMGKWQQHPHNPQQFDAVLSRSAGHLFDYGGEKLRPVQDCSLMYGGGLKMCRIDALGDNQFSQTPIGGIRVNKGYGCHTFNQHAGLEVIDLFGRIAFGDVIAYYTRAVN